jgi:hypothetical protein
MKRILVALALASCHRPGVVHRTVATDLDLDGLAAWFGSPHIKTGMADDDALRVLDDFRTAETPELPASGEEVWFGATYDVEGTSRFGFVFLRVRPDGGYATGLITESGEEDGDAHRLLNAVRSGQAPPDSPALSYVKTAKATGPYVSWSLVGKSRALGDDPPRWLRRAGSRLLMIQPLRRGGRFAELWRLP